MTDWMISDDKVILRGLTPLNNTAYGKPIVAIFNK